MCTVEGCDGRDHARGWCRPHWERWRRHGDPLAGRRSPSPGQACDVEGCDKPAVARGWCTGHYQRWNQLGDPVASKPRPRRSARYSAIHWRLTRDLGSARKRDCVDCGKPARHWSYNGGDPEELLDPYPLSVDQTRYSPRCNSCHVRLDKNRAKGEV